ncbi:phage tail length tape measure family protein [Aminobacter aminovorans]|uniref:Bacteriophage tail tape measure N-terminal domain-containing protein n=1 Tax=Aminobacter aminovorans TaxID=83263 RepID=A0AAC8YMJ4_AMIAI|nr:phage tail length tape measure family protein [Aminobacter aminovorans]AMS41155.1 hypothetical protein AA2016_2226 [Aminobacter aminovorans]MBB3705864.1 hypothetical protein [Aminobacter aminovorans]
MTVQLSALRVSADLNASGFVSGASQVTKAEQDMVAGARQVSVALADQQGKVSAAGNPLARLSRQYIDGYGSAQRFESGLRSLNRMLEKGEIEARQAEAVYTGMAQKLGLVANAADVTAQGYARLGGVIDTVNTKLAQQSSLAATAATGLGRIGGVNDNEASFRRRNMTYQAFDVVQMAALGQAPAMLALQQGPQIAQLYAGPGGVTAALSDAAMVATRLIGVLRAVGPAALGVGTAYSFVSEEVRKATGQAASFGEVAMASLALLSRAVEPLTGPVFEAAFYAFERLGSAALDWADLIVSSFNKVGYDIGFIFGEAGTAIEAAIVGSLNVGIRALNGFTEKAIAAINSIIEGWNKLGVHIGMGVGGLDPSTGRIREFQNDAAAQLAEAVAARNAYVAGNNTPVRDGLRGVGGEVIDRRTASKSLTDLQALGSVSFAESIKGASGLAGEVSRINSQVSQIGVDAGSSRERVIDLGAAWDAARRSQIASSQALAEQLRSTEALLKDRQASIRDAAKTPVDVVFGDASKINNATGAITSATSAINGAFAAMDQGRMTASSVFSVIEMVRQSMLGMGGDAQSINAWIDILVKAELQVRALNGDVKTLRELITSIPDKTINIKINETTTRTTYGNGVNVYRSNGGADSGGSSPSNSQIMSGLGGYEGDFSIDYPWGTAYTSTYEIGSGRRPVVHAPTAYAKGGIATEASIFGEAGPEAAVPLPDGRTIPVTLSGGGMLAAIEANTALTVDQIERLIGITNTMSGDILAMLRRSQASASASLGSRATGSSGAATGGVGGGIWMEPTVKAINTGYGAYIPGKTGYATGGMMGPFGSGSTDSMFAKFMFRPDETISIHTPAQRKAVVDALDRAGEGGGTSVSFGDIIIQLPAGADQRQGQQAGRAAADEFTRRVRGVMGARLHG